MRNAKLKIAKDFRDNYSKLHRRLIRECDDPKEKEIIENIWNNGRNNFSARHIKKTKRPTMEDKKKRRYTKLNKQQKKDCVKYAIEMIIAGHRLVDVQRMVGEKFLLSDHTIRVYYKQAREELQRQSQYDIKEALGTGLARYYSLLQRAFEINDLKLCMLLNEKIIQLQGIEPVKKSQVSLTMKPLNQYTDEELRVLIESESPANATKLLELNNDDEIIEGEYDNEEVEID